MSDRLSDEQVATYAYVPPPRNLAAYDPVKVLLAREVQELRAEVERLTAENTETFDHYRKEATAHDAERALADQLAEALQRLYDGFSDKAITAIAAWEAARHE